MFSKHMKMTVVGAAGLGSWNAEALRIKKHVATSEQANQKWDDLMELFRAKPEEKRKLEQAPDFADFKKSIPAYIPKVEDFARANDWFKAARNPTWGGLLGGYQYLKRTWELRKQKRAGWGVCDDGRGRCFAPSEKGLVLRVYVVTSNKGGGVSGSPGHIGYYIGKSGLGGEGYYGLKTNIDKKEGVILQLAGEWENGQTRTEIRSGRRWTKSTSGGYAEYRGQFAYIARKQEWLPHGFGTKTYPDGSWYSGSWKSGVWDLAEPFKAFTGTQYDNRLLEQHFYQGLVLGAHDIRDVRPSTIDVSKSDFSHHFNGPKTFVQRTSGSNETKLEMTMSSQVCDSVFDPPINGERYYYLYYPVEANPARDQIYRTRYSCQNVY